MNKTVRSNALWVILGRIGQMAIQLVLMVLTARYLGPSDFGLIHYVAAYTGFFPLSAVWGCRLRWCRN